MIQYPIEHLNVHVLPTKFDAEQDTELPAGFVRGGHVAMET